MISKLEISFSTNINEENTVLKFTKEQLKGLTDDQLNGYKNEILDDGTTIYYATLKTPDYNPIMKYCSVPETRKEMEMAYNSRCIDKNSKIMEELAKYRNDQANKLGFDTHADYVLDILIAKNRTTVDNFLKDLNIKLDDSYNKDINELLKLKIEECRELNLTCDNIIHSYDRLYYTRIYNDKYYNIDDEELKKYFLYDKVVDSMFRIYQTVFSVRFRELSNDKDNKFDMEQLWNPDVRYFEVKDADTTSTTYDQVIGYFYMDMFPREGKYSHAAAYQLITGSVNPLKDDNNTTSSSEPERILPIVAIVCNFPKPQRDRPSTLTHRDVETLFHEFGHCLHNILSLTELQEFSGTNVSQDFVEAPSQMLENWVWEKPILQLIGSNSIPDEMIDKLISSRMSLSAIYTKRQLIFAILDQRIHTNRDINIDDILINTVKDVLHSDSYITPGTNMIASFGHLSGGYDARYYSYLWSEVYAADMFVRGFKYQVLDPVAGLRYRRNVLQVGDSIDAVDAVTNFLDSPPNQDAFLA